MTDKPNAHSEIIIKGKEQGMCILNGRHKEFCLSKTWNKIRER